jgi:hypothetical protein
MPDKIIDRRAGICKVWLGPISANATVVKKKAITNCNFGGMFCVTRGKRTAAKK